MKAEGRIRKIVRQIPCLKDLLIYTTKGAACHERGYAIEMRDICKQFGPVIANDHVDFAARPAKFTP
ncbi:hypothetical protein [Cohnella faecalis]|uniref:hypothetical protein n=1 Tax=Cohnella faecalis TaxID=2315694 RepID=UPI001F28E202|nr:hypothetical protein [Cohnella faecalis]